jgi:uncharacterized protein (TIGR02186 family)
MRRRIAISLGALALATLLSTAARAEHLIVSVSNHRVTVTPNYAGEELVLFGAIENDATTPVSRGSYDIVVTISGPRTTVVTRRKARVFGIWVNADSREFLNVPSYLAVFSNQPLYAIATPDVLRRQQLGMDNIILTQRVGSDVADVVADDPFRRAFVRLHEEHGLYRESSNAVTFLTSNLFRTGIPLPAEVPIGTYQIEIKLLANGAPIAHTETAFEIAKVGFEQFVANAARNRSLGYGLVTAVMALMTGWFASVVFRKD